ncbi:hypothetical protein ATN84_01830 [Paramesorhizobium deserti]|uniref:O-antigen ligase-related domain-containing protein n=1 Tax=Paramesorhizobium deserti TaxID=1494590 RepID=A0A135HZD9_9HYPH|nr:O-antigen ligase [Paramesorhizobium deserti]KXF78557.1 hypothetical protein ATN84_01830 [Paramesorhizobium deserti]
MRLSRSFFFLAVFALFWVTTAPFIDLSNPDILRAQESGNAGHQIAILLLLAMSIGICWQNGKVALSAISGAMICVLLWQLFTVVTSSHPDQSIRRYILNVAVTIIALAWLLAPENTTQFRRLLRYGAAFVLGLAYFGVIVLPNLSIHNMGDITELVNAGSWRGHFAHKNIAGPAMVVLILYWLYFARTTDKTMARIIYWSLAALSLNFLYHTNNKTSIGLLLAMFVLAALIRRVRFLPLQMALAFIPVALMDLLTLGSVIFKPVGELVAALISDPTFTNRTEIWRFAINRLQEHPLIGYGFEAFWASSDLRGTFQETWAASAGHAHNGLLNVAMSSGLIGVFLTLWWVYLNPVLDFNKSQKTGNDPHLALLYLRIWMFMMLYANLESPFFVGRGQVWFTLLGAMLGLRLHARTHQVVEQTALRHGAVDKRPVRPYRNALPAR